MQIRNKDNYSNAYDYIQNQLFVYTYTNEEHVHILKMKLWTLDSEFSSREIEEGLTDYDISSPTNHKEALEAELVFLDRYRKTKDGLLDKNEQNFTTLMSERKKSMRTWIRERDPITNEKRQDYEMAYSQRPSLLSETQFATLYKLYKIKEAAGELSDCFEITSSITTDNTDTSITSQCLTIDNYQSVEDTKAQMLENAASERARVDDNYISEMQTAHYEIIDILKESIPDLPEGPSATITNPDYVAGGTESETLPNPIQWSDSSIVIVNFPAIREYISLTQNDSSHKGIIIDEMGTGGYRFTVKTTDDFITIKSVPDTGTFGFSNTVSPYLTGEVEWNFDDVVFAHYYIESDSDNGTSTTYLTPLTTIISDKDRFDVLAERWVNINELRENVMLETGIRIQIESMVDSEPIDTLDSLEKHLEDLIDNKEKITDILRERCLFSEWA